MAEFFRRIEKKYLVSEKQYKILKELMKAEMTEDSHGKSKVNNIYFDDKNYSLIRNSIEKPIFKDKVRLRSYNIPTLDSKVYLEIKRKYKDIVSKRRIETILKDVYKYIENKNINPKNQIMKEIDYYFKLYNLKKTAYISYDREAFYGNEDNDFRVTFDNNIVARTYDLFLEKGSYGEQILNNGFYLMEVKTLGSMPMWFVKAISNLEIYPYSFSKYGETYKNMIASNIEQSA